MIFISFHFEGVKETNSKTDNIYELICLNDPLIIK